MQEERWREPGCRTVCRPYRTKARVFGAKDVGRVARYAIREGEDPAVIVAHVMIALGYDKIICNSVKALNDFSTLVGFVGRVKGVAAILVSLSALIEWIKDGPLTRIPYGRAILALSVAIFALMDGILSVLFRWNLFSIKLQLAVATLGAWCGWIRIIRTEQGGQFETSDDYEPPDFNQDGLPDDVPFMTEEEFQDGLTTEQ